MKISKSTRTYIRRKKEGIRQTGVGPEEQQKQVDRLYESLGISRPTELLKTK